MNGRDTVTQQPSSRVEAYGDCGAGLPIVDTKPWAPSSYPEVAIPMGLLSGAHEMLLTGCCFHSKHPPPGPFPGSVSLNGRGGLRRVWLTWGDP